MSFRDLQYTKANLFPLSPSSLSKYKLCLALGAYGEMKGNERSMRIGEAFHEFQNELMNYRIGQYLAGKDDEPDRIRVIIEKYGQSLPRAWQKEYQTLVCQSMKTPALTVQEALSMNFRAFGVEKKLVFDEQWHLFDDWDDPRTFLRGIIDFYIVKDDYAIVLDYKTTKNKHKWLALDHFKIGIYAAMIHAAYPSIKRVIAILDYVATGTEERKSYNADMLFSILDEIRRFARKIEEARHTKELSPRKNDFCEYCSLKSKCPVFQKPGRFRIMGWI